MEEFPDTVQVGAPSGGNCCEGVDTVLCFLVYLPALAPVSPFSRVSSLLISNANEGGECAIVGKFTIITAKPINLENATVVCAVV